MNGAPKGNRRRTTMTERKGRAIAASFFGQMHAEPNEIESWPLTALHEKVFKTG